MAELILTKSYVAIVDDADAEWLSQWKWTAVVTGKHIKRVYAYRRAGWDAEARRQRPSIYLHRSLMDAPKGMDVDHIDGDTLNNRRGNLRVCTRSQNLANNRRALGSSGFRGVIVDTRDGGINARLGLSHLGRYPTLEAAARAYDAAAHAKFGEFAKLNFPHEAPLKGIASAELDLCNLAKGKANVFRS